jgi:arylformamidase
MATAEWIDVSATISDGMLHWPSDPPTKIYQDEKIGVNGAVANVTTISASAHLGTHVDAPLHFFANAMDVSAINLEILIGPAKVIQIQDKEKISYDEIKKYAISENDRILFRTHNSDTDWEREPFMKDYVYLATDAARHLSDMGVKCIGVDYLSIGGKENNPEVHRLLLGKPIIIIEGLKLGHVEPGSYDMICLPLKIKGSDGGPARVILKKRS